MYHGRVMVVLQSEMVDTGVGSVLVMVSARIVSSVVVMVGTVAV